MLLREVRFGSRRDELRCCYRSAVAIITRASDVYPHIHSAPYSRFSLSPRGFSTITAPFWYLLKVKSWTRYPWACFNLGTNPKWFITLHAFGGICIPAPTAKSSGARSTTVTAMGGCARRHAIAHDKPPMPAPTTTTWRAVELSSWIGGKVSF